VVAAVFGIVGWKNNGKTTLLVKLVELLTRRGWRVATVKHAHHDFDIDHEGTDSWRHAKAGASEVAIVSPRRWALIHENDRGEDAPSLATMMEKFAPCDLILVEGYKQGSHAKLEVHRHEGKRGKQGEILLAQTDCHVVAIASDTRLQNMNLPIFDLDDIETIADFIENHTKLKEVSDVNLDGTA